MKSRKFRNGTKRWKQNGHKTIQFYSNTYGKHGISMWERSGKMKGR